MRLPRMPLSIPSWLATALAGNGRFRRRWVVTMLRKAAQTGFPSLVRSRVGDARLALDPSQDDQYHMLLGSHDPEVLSVLRQVLGPGDTYADAGAHIGFMAAAAASQVGPTGRLLLFEPDPQVFARLDNHMRSIPESVRPDVRLFPEACSSDSAGRPFLSDQASGRSRIPADDPDKLPSGATRVRSRPLDDTFQEEGVASVRLLKVDVEGHEIELLQGLGRFLEQRRVDYLVIEKNERLLFANGYAAQHLHALLTSHGYFGAHADSGKRVCLSSLAESGWLENLVYAGDATRLAELFPALAGQLELEPESSAAIQDLVRELDDPECPGRAVPRAIYLARRERLEEAVAIAERLQGDPPKSTPLCGHLAHWYHAQGRVQAAIDQLELYLNFHPNDRPAVEEQLAAWGAAGRPDATDPGAA